MKIHPSTHNHVFLGCFFCTWTAEELLEAQKKHMLPQTHDEFEARAILYHIFLDLEDFLLRKKQFIDRLDNEQKILHWQNKG